MGRALPPLNWTKSKGTATFFRRPSLKPLVSRADVGEVTGMGRVVVDLVMKAGGTHLRLKEAAVAGLDR